MAQVAIYDTETGAITAYVIVPDGDVAANVAVGQSALAISQPVSSERHYVDPTGDGPTIEDRPVEPGGS